MKAEARQTCLLGSALAAAGFRFHSDFGLLAAGFARNL
jgi:hypothetical protein